MGKIRNRVKTCLLIFAVCALGFGVEAETQTPNIILMMADDLGYGDTGFNGNKIIKTPHMDALAKRGITLTHFYSGNSVCSPTRATCLTGRHHDRFGIYGANQAHLPAQEITLARMLKSKGYTTGHFGKWHLGTLSKTMSAKGEKRKPELNFAPPWERDYDASFVVESAICTWNPGLGKRAKNNPFYENGVALDGSDESLLGGAARVVVDRAVPFIEQAVADKKPFLAVVWFNAPHEDIEAGPEYLKMYEGHGEAAHFYGCITELDEQVGRIFQTLEKSGAAENTLIFFCSDNGPEGKQAAGRRMGTTDGLRGRKRALYDGGVRVPAFAVWPGKIEAGIESGAILSTLDYFPTIGKLVDYQMPDARPLDGQDILPVLIGKSEARERAIPFRYANGTSSLVKDGYKLLMPAGELYDLSKDRAEENDVAAQFPERVDNMKRELIAFFQSVEKSHSGADYKDPAYQPVNKWKSLKLNKGKK
ncbi:sulfatase family protein [Pontiella sulfatireligans]|uniref:Arylsulfatase n=1 Tax=Pontiella sulfatireligans TaxID=2750658 RepID=A0A6C2UH22_9BACT|nr:sulfatase-like hydrolase/transferase [Pontiella sulfatireligans]SPS74301.1 sulfatase S1_23 [Kiritimatiellales bacterium]VGO19229.1 Arylsulfatase [Pontiella sulfatireligans]